MTKSLTEYLGHIALMDLKAVEYKTLLLILDKPQTQMMICTKLGICKQNINKAFKTLEQYGLIEIDKVEGRNKFYKSITDLDKLDRVMPGQMEM